MIYSAHRNDFIAAQAAAEGATTAKDDALEELVEAIKTDIHYAENTVDFDDDKLKLIGWAGRKKRTPLAPPGQVRLLEASPQTGRGLGILGLEVSNRRRRRRTIQYSNGSVVALQAPRAQENNCTLWCIFIHISSVVDSQSMIKNLFSSQLRINVASGVVVTVINTAAMIAAYPIYLHFLGYEKYGVWLVLATVLSFAQLGNLGIGQAVIKLVAEEHGREDIEGIQRYVTTALALLCLSGSFVLIVVLVFKAQIVAAFKLSDENAQTAFWLLPYIGILSIYVFVVQTLNATLSGLGRMDWANYAQSAGRIVAVATAGSLLYRGYGIESLLIGNTLSYMLVHLVSLILIWRIAHIRFLRIGNFNAQCCKRLLRFGGGIFGGTLVSMLLSPFNKLMLSRYAGVSTIPVYEIAFNGSMQVRALIEAGLRALMPEVSRIGAKMTRDAKNRISHIYRRAMRLIFMFGVPMYGALIIFSPLLLEVWLGDRFVETLPWAFRIMLVGTFLSLSCVPAYYTLMGLGMVRHCFLSQVIQGTVNMGVVVTIVLVSGRVSVYSIAWSSLVAMGMTSIYVLFQKHQTMKSVSW